MRRIRLPALGLLVGALTWWACVGEDPKLDGTGEDAGDGGAGAGEDGAAKSDASNDGGVVDPSGLVAHWKFDETRGPDVVDVAPEPRNGKLGPGGSLVKGQLGNALKVDGKGLGASIPFASKLGVGPAFTVTAWVNLSETGNESGEHKIFARGYSFDLKLNGRKPQLSRPPADGGALRYALANQDVPIDEWHHIAVTFDRGSVHWFIDGDDVAVDNKFSPGDVMPSNIDDTIVGAHANGADPMTGLIDALRLYDRALSTAEIDAIRAAQ